MQALPHPRCMTSDFLLPHLGLSLALIRPHCCFSCIRDVLKPPSLLGGTLSPEGPRTSRTPQTSSISLDHGDAEAVQGFTCRPQRCNMGSGEAWHRCHGRFSAASCPDSSCLPKKAEHGPELGDPTMCHMETAAHGPGKSSSAEPLTPTLVGFVSTKTWTPSSLFPALGALWVPFTAGAGCQRQGWEPRATESQPRCLCPGTPNQLSCGSKAAQLPGSPSSLSPAGHGTTFSTVPHPGAVTQLKSTSFHTAKEGSGGFVCISAPWAARDRASQGVPRGGAGSPVAPAPAIRACAANFVDQEPPPSGRMIWLFQHPWQGHGDHPHSANHHRGDDGRFWGGVGSQVSSVPCNAALGTQMLKTTLAPSHLFLHPLWHPKRGVLPPAVQQEEQARPQ